MTDELITAALGVIAALMTLFAAWLNSKKKEAYEQGDKILAAFGQMTELASGLAIVFPQIKVEAESLEDMYAKFKQGWEDKSFTTEQMNALYEDGLAFFNAVMEKVALLKR